jgi:uncharacterized Zn-binding protein involved in type VI secretion
MIARLAAAATLVACAHAEEPKAPPAAPATTQAAPVCAAMLGGGSPDVMIEGRAAARTGDAPCYEIIGGARSVLTNGRPTLRVGDEVRCPNGKTGVVEGGAASVFIEGRYRALARRGLRVAALLKTLDRGLRAVSIPDLDRSEACCQGGFEIGRCVVRDRVRICLVAWGQREDPVRRHRIETIPHFSDGAARSHQVREVNELPTIIVPKRKPRCLCHAENVFHSGI